MRKVLFQFIAVFFLLLNFFAGGVDLSLEQQAPICLFFIFTLGIPHGALDNVLFLSEHRLSKTRFYLSYLGVIGLNIFLWLVFPVFTLLLFLVISAYHFGQSQFTQYFDSEKLRHNALHLFWGVALISGLILFNHGEIQTLLNSSEDLSRFKWSGLYFSMLLIFIVSSTLTTGLLVYLFVKKELGADQLALELFALAILLLGFYIFPLLIGFTMYFVILHSLKVLQEEFAYLKLRNITRSIWGFVKMVFPFTLISVAGIILVFYFIEIELLPISYAYALLILISSITLPHALVMEKFYGNYRPDLG